MLAHFFKHFNSGGSGIRNVMDVHVFLSQYGDVLDRAYVDRELEKMELTEFRRDMEELAEQWFGETQDLGSVREDLEETFGKWVEDGEFPNDDAALKAIVEGICFYNAKRYFGL